VSAAKKETRMMGENDALGCWRRVVSSEGEKQQKTQENPES
jgi:hypothetical protein